MHGIRHDQARANKGVDLIESPRTPPTAGREHHGRSIDFPRVHHTDLLHGRRYYAAIEFRLPRGVYRLIRRRTQKLWIPWKVSSTKARLNGPVQSHISLNRYSVTSSFDRDIERSGVRDCCAIQFRSSDITLWKIRRWYYTWIESLEILVFSSLWSSTLKWSKPGVKIWVRCGCGIYVCVCICICVTKGIRITGIN